MNRVQAVVFDMDGVLVESEDLWLRARTEFAASIGRVWTAEDQVATMGCNTAAWARIMVQRLELQAHPGMDEAGVAHEIITRMQALYAAHLPAREGAVQATKSSAASRRPTSTCACWNASACTPKMPSAWKTRATAFVRCTLRAWASSRHPARAMRSRPKCWPWPAPIFTA